jgi:hypothetical protein
MDAELAEDAFTSSDAGSGWLQEARRKDAVDEQEGRALTPNETQVINHQGGRPDEAFTFDQDDQDLGDDRHDAAQLSAMNRGYLWSARVGRACLAKLPVRVWFVRVRG